jgi:Mn2+/Fe2+ NRAMP family transporter
MTLDEARACSRGNEIELGVAPPKRQARCSARLKAHPLAFPLMAAVQSMCANLGRVTGRGLAAQAASALRPLAGDFAYLLFSPGILGVGFIGVPVLAGSRRR